MLRQPGNRPRHDWPGYGLCFVFSAVNSCCPQKVITVRKVRTVLFFSDKILIESLPTVLGMVNGPTASALPDGSEADTDLQRLIDLGHQVFT